MRVLITGATGFLGRRLSEQLHEQGHELSALSRDPKNARSRMPQLVGAFPWEIFDKPPVEAFEGVTTVIHLAGETVAERWNQAKKQLIYDSRVLGTRHVVEAMKELKTRPSALITASAIGYYGDRGDEVLTEESSAGTDFLARVCTEWEHEAVQAESLGMRVVRLRTGLVLGPGGGALQAMLPIFRLGLGGSLGSGRQWWSWIHRDDVIGAMMHALEKSEVSGPINVTAPQPVRQRDFAQILGRTLRRPAFLPAPAFAIRIALGGFASELLSSKHVLPERLHKTDYRFHFTELEPTLRDTL